MKDIGDKLVEGETFYQIPYLFQKIQKKTNITPTFNVSPSKRPTQLLPPESLLQKITISPKQRFFSSTIKVTYLWLRF